MRFEDEGAEIVDSLSDDDVELLEADSEINTTKIQKQSQFFCKTKIKFQTDF